MEIDYLNIYLKNNIIMVTERVVISSRTGTYSTEIGMTMIRRTGDYAIQTHCCSIRQLLALMLSLCRILAEVSQRVDAVVFL